MDTPGYRTVPAGYEHLFAFGKLLVELASQDQQRLSACYSRGGLVAGRLPGELTGQDALPGAFRPVTLSLQGELHLLMHPCRNLARHPCF